MPIKSRNLEALLRPLVNALHKAGDPALLFNAVVEAAWLVAASDDNVDDVEVANLHAAVKALADDWMDEAEVDTLFADLVEYHAAEGHDARCKVAGRNLKKVAVPAIKLAAYLGYVSAGLAKGEFDTLVKIAAAAGLDRETVDLLTLEMRPHLHES